MGWGHGFGWQWSIKQLNHLTWGHLVHPCIYFVVMYILYELLCTILYKNQQPLVLLVMFDWLELIFQMREEWRFVWTMSGAQFVMTPGGLLMLL